MPQAAAHRGRASFANGQNFREVGRHQCPSERKGEGVPVRRLRVPSHVPSHPQTAAKVRGFALTAARCTAETDCLLEEGGFELSVPVARTQNRFGKWNRHRGEKRSRNTVVLSGTVGSNPPSSSGGSDANSARRSYPPSPAR
jgi:hypothetical protein